MKQLVEAVLLLLFRIFLLFCALTSANLDFKALYVNISSKISDIENRFCHDSGHTLKYLFQMNISDILHHGETRILPAIALLRPPVSDSTFESTYFAVIST